MDQLLTDAQRTFRDEIAAFAAEEIAPHVDEWEASQGFPTSAVRAAADRGLLGLVIPTEYGGRGVDHVSHGLFIREIARVCSGAALTLDAMTTVGVEPVLYGGSDELKARWLPRVARGELTTAFSITEPEAGSDAANMAATAKRDGDEYVLDGHKTLCTNGGFADLYVVNAKTVDPSGRPAVSAFLVEAGTPGLSFGAPLEKLGLFGSVQSEVFLDGVRIPADQLIGGEGDGMRLAMRALDSGRIGVAFQAVGTAEAALAAATSYVVEREAFGRTLADLQGVQFQLAEHEADLAAARALAWQAAHLCDRGLPFSREAAIAKLVATEACMRICSGAVDLFGGHGYTRRHPVERYFRDAKGMQLYEGTSNVQRIVIARAVLRDARSGR